MTRDPAFAAGITRFFAGPLVRCSLLMGGFATLARNLALLGRIHRRESTIFFGHLVPPTPNVPARLTRTGFDLRVPAATEVPRDRRVFGAKRLFVKEIFGRGGNRPNEAADYPRAERICRAGTHATGMGRRREPTFAKMGKMMPRATIATGDSSSDDCAGTIHTGQFLPGFYTAASGRAASTR